MEEKKRAAEYLTANGYPAIVQDGVVLVRAIDNTTFGKVKKLLQGIGYNYSFGAIYNLQISTAPKEDEVMSIEGGTNDG